MFLPKNSPFIFLAFTCIAPCVAPADFSKLKNLNEGTTDWTTIPCRKAVPDDTRLIKKFIALIGVPLNKHLNKWGSIANRIVSLEEFEIDVKSLDQAYFDNLNLKIEPNGKQLLRSYNFIYPEGVHYSGRKQTSRSELQHELTPQDITAFTLFLIPHDGKKYLACIYDVQPHNAFHPLGRAEPSVYGVNALKSPTPNSFIHRAFNEADKNLFHAVINKYPELAIKEWNKIAHEPHDHSPSLQPVVVQEGKKIIVIISNSTMFKAEKPRMGLDLHLDPEGTSLKTVLSCYDEKKKTTYSKTYTVELPEAAPLKHVASVATTSYKAEATELIQFVVVIDLK